MKWLLRLFIMTLLLNCAVQVAQAASAITGIEIEETEKSSEVLKFKTKSPLKARRAFTLPNPDRIVIDLPKIANASVPLPKDYKGTLIKSVRFGQFDRETSRIVIDLGAPAQIITTIDGSPLRIEIAAEKKSAVSKGEAEVPKEEAKVEEEEEEAEEEKKNPESPPPDEKPLIMIDAGHGGQDPGAIGIHKTREKEITLSYARHLRDALIATGRYRAQLTRKDDTFVTLKDRVMIARKEKADIFISFHADSNPRREAQGLSIYTLSETASDDEAAALAEHENKADIIPGIDLSTTDADVASILIDLTQRETMNKSSIFADAIVKSLNKRVNKLPKVHRYAGFRVLKAPDIPSVLIELGFLSNKRDERLLLTKEYREAVIRSIVKGIDRYRAGE